MHFEIYILIVFQFALMFCSTSLCPDHPKCNCLDAANKITVECTYLENFSQLGDIFKKDLISKSVSLLQLPYCSATTVTKNALSNASIQNIHSTCPFRKMAANSLSSIDSLKELKLLSTKFKTIPKGIGDLKNLKILQVINGELTGIDFEIHNMSGLVKLYLKNNHIRNVSRNAFAGNPEMKVIDLSENRLVYIEPGTFDSCQQLEQISLQKNRIKSVVGLFGIPKLQAPPIFPDAVGELLLQNNSLGNPLKLNISNSAKLKLLNIEKNHVTEIDFYLPNNIQTLMLSGNNFNRFKAYFPPSLITWTLSDNSWICDCDSVPFWKFIMSPENVILDRNVTRCSIDTGREETRGKLLIDLTETEICPPSYIVLYASLAAGLVMISVLAIVSHLGYRRYRYHIKVWFYSRGLQWLKKKNVRDVGKYDAYLAFSDDDVLFVRQHILPELEEKDPYYSVYVPQRNLIGGEFKIHSEIENARKSKRMIVLLSQNYIEDELRMEVFRVMHTTCLEEQLYRIILVFLTDLPPLPYLDPSLRTAIEATRCLKFGQKLFWDMLRFAMPDPETDAEEEVDEENDNSDTPLIVT